MRPKASPRLLAIGALLLVVAIWGSTFVATKLLFDQIGPIGLSLLRFAIAAAILVPLTNWRSAGPLPWGRFALLGLTGVVLYYLGQNVGLVYTSATAASLIVAIVPATIAIAAAVFLGERLNLQRMLGVVASIVGVVLIVLNGKPEPSSPQPLLGNLLIVGAILAWTAYTVLGKDLARLPFQITSAATVGFGALFLLPLAGWEFATSGLPALTTTGWLWVLYLGAGASAAAYYLWNFALRVLSASEAAVYLNLVPVCGVVLAATMLGETVGLAEIAGGVLIVVGVTFASRAPSEKPSPIAEPALAREA